MYTLNGWWFLSSSGSYPLVFMVDQLNGLYLRSPFHTTKELHSSIVESLALYICRTALFSTWYPFEFGCNPLTLQSSDLMLPNYPTRLFGLHGRVWLKGFKVANLRIPSGRGTSGI